MSQCPNCKVDAAIEVRCWSCGEDLMNRPYLAECVVRVKDVYKRGFTIPPTYKDIAFRIPKHGETYINPVTGTHHITCTGDKMTSPRIILEPIKLKEVVFRETGEVRPPKAGEWFLTTYGSLEPAGDVDWGYTKKPIYTRTEREV